MRLVAAPPRVERARAASDCPRPPCHATRRDARRARSAAAALMMFHYCRPDFRHAATPICAPFITVRYHFRLRLRRTLFVEDATKKMRRKARHERRLPVATQHAALMPLFAAAHLLPVCCVCAPCCCCPARTMPRYRYASGFADGALFHKDLSPCAEEICRVRRAQEQR